MNQPTHHTEPASRRVRLRGVTLVELMVALAIATLLLTLGISGMGRLIAENQRVAAVNTLIANLNYARAQAIYRATNVAVCPIKPGTAKVTNSSKTPCTTVRAADRDVQWHQGYAIYVVSTNERLRIEAGVTAVRIESSPTVARFTFQPDGSLTTFGGQLRVCDAADTSKTDAGRKPGTVAPRVVVIDAVGRVRVSARAPGTAEGEGDAPTEDEEGATGGTGTGGGTGDPEDADENATPVAPPPEGASIDCSI